MSEKEKDLEAFKKFTRDYLECSLVDFYMDSCEEGSTYLAGGSEFSDFDYYETLKYTKKMLPKILKLLD